TSDLVDFYLDRIQQKSSLNCFVETFDESARAQALEIDKKIKAGTAGKLAGLVLGIKDVLCYKGQHLTASSKILNGFESLFTGTALQRLLDEDVIIIGRQNCDEFAMGSSNENSSYGVVRNPVDPDRVPGGSSGGSASAVGAGLCHASLGSDTGGSVRQPASFCGVVGLKPSYGRVSRWGLIAYASSFDQIGPITNSVEDSARILEVMAGKDERDTTSSSMGVVDYPSLIQSQPEKKYTIGYIKEALFSDGLDPEIKAYILQLIDQLKSQGHTVKEVTFPYLSYVVPCYYILTTAEASSNLARFDGIRYGHRSDEGFGEEVKRRIMLGTFVLSSGYYDAYYTKAMRTRRLIRNTTLELLETCDFLLTPTAPTTAFPIGEKADDPIAMYLSDIYTVHANLAGIPAISLPLAKHSDGMPIGVQLMGRHFDEGNLLAFSHRLMMDDSK
ncbi:UNVERIFIED_CONTAM: hypothetical protein GTU68_029383, partial [Idotea baltica]|nr:hypothetical protein [Idotea baltica]